MFSVWRIVEGGFSGESKWWRCALDIRGEYMVKWRRVRSCMRSILVASGLRVAKLGCEREEGKKRYRTDQRTQNHRYG